MLKHNFVIILLLLLSISSYGQQSITFLTYNVENLFDTNDDAHKNDSEFLPQGSKSWTEDRYQLKIEQIATVLDSTGADIMGLTEVENYKVVSFQVGGKILLVQCPA